MRKLYAGYQINIMVFGFSALISRDKELKDTLTALNGSYIETLDSPPSALEFARLVHVSRPVIIKGAATISPEKWSDEYLRSAMGDRPISVAVTPNGRADAITPGPDGTLYFTEPCTEQITMTELLDSLSDDTRQEVLYLQSQNGNLYRDSFFEQEQEEMPSGDSEFEALRPNAPSHIPWCTEAFGKFPDAVNLWIGNHKSQTSIHSDPYENLYTVVRGTKHFLLLPPTEGWCTQERLYPHANYSRPKEGGGLELIPSGPEVPSVRWASVANPHLPGALPKGSHPFRITLNAGDSLYLPVGWWHHVRQGEGITVALNWWYDTEMRGNSWTWLSLLRGGQEDGDSDSNGE